MSVELYPNVEDLDERLSALEDVELAERIVSANPQLFASAAAREEVSIFAVAWKRIGAIALAVAATLAVGAGFALRPHTAAQPALRPVAVPLAVRENTRRPPAILRVQPPRRHPALVPIAPVAAHVSAQKAPVSTPARHVVAYHVPAAASRAIAPAAHAIAAPASASAAAPAAEAPIQYEANTQIVSGNVPPMDSAAPSYTKSVPVDGAGDTSILDSCTPSGGRLGYLMQR